MRIALVHYSSLPVVGGVEIVMDAHATLLAAGGHSVRLVCARGGQAREGVEAHSIARERSLSPADRRLELRVALQHCEVVILHNVGTMPFDLALTEAIWELAAELRDVRWICWIHDIAGANPDYAAGADERWKLLQTWNPRWEYVAVSELRATEWAELTGSPRGEVRVIPNGIDVHQVLGLTPFASKVEREHSLLTRDLVLFHPTRLLRRKNLELGLRVTHALRGSGLDAVYLATAAPEPHGAARFSAAEPKSEGQIPADPREAGAYTTELRLLRTQLGLEKDAIFLHEIQQVEPGDLPSFYALADALFLPSRQEGFGLPMLEAALYRLPAFCAAIEPLQSLPGAHPVNLSAPPSEIAQAIIRQMRHWPSNSPRRAVARNYAWPAIYRNFLAPLLAEIKNPAHS